MNNAGENVIKIDTKSCTNSVKFILVLDKFATLHFLYCDWNLFFNECKNKMTPKMEDKHLKALDNATQENL